MPYKIVINRPACVGAGTCIEEAQQTFDFDQEDKAIVISETGNQDDEILYAAQCCPANAIILIDPETNQQVWPEEE